MDDPGDIYVNKPLPEFINSLIENISRFDIIVNKVESQYKQHLAGTTNKLYDPLFYIYLNLSFDFNIYKDDVEFETSIIYNAEDKIYYITYKPIFYNNEKVILDFNAKFEQFDDYENIPYTDENFELLIKTKIFEYIMDKKDIFSFSVINNILLKYFTVDEGLKVRRDIQEISTKRNTS